VLPGNEADAALKDNDEENAMPKLTKRLIDSLEAAADRDHFVWDSKLTGFGLRLTRTGRKAMGVAQSGAQQHPPASRDCEELRDHIISA
jgi:hypothetical protein